jgi:hypothetical protein
LKKKIDHFKFKQEKRKTTTTTTTINTEKTINDLKGKWKSAIAKKYLNLQNISGNIDFKVVFKHPNIKIK